MRRKGKIDFLIS